MEASTEQQSKEDSFDFEDRKGSFSLIKKLKSVFKGDKNDVSIKKISIVVLISLSEGKYVHSISIN